MVCASPVEPPHTGSIRSDVTGAGSPHRGPVNALLSLAEWPGGVITPPRSGSVADCDWSVGLWQCDERRCPEREGSLVLVV